ncbi:lysosomal acid glucosylceramidase-like [Bacillus rossius redtenbacheri]|uniref:lysosomal acid glucosylceramidase-like n=1 Tax=Bacillus rossius redtenbacheri TaxID=93214 RepID=UPI002FDC94E0
MKKWVGYKAAGRGGSGSVIRATAEMTWRFLAGLLCVGAALSAQYKPCLKRNYGASSIVCVCNATYCDTVRSIQASQVSGGNFMHYESSMAGLRLHPQEGKFSSAAANTVIVFTVQPSTTYQEMLGFGAALTDSTAYNLYTLNEKTREMVLQTYFGDGGSDYLFLRVNMGACDFSLSYYSYDDVAGDTALSHFSLPKIDVDYKIPIVKRASQIRGQAIRLFAQPWSAPTWMKDSGTWYTGSLLEKYYQPWANYFVKYFEAYKSHGVSYWGLTPQNEPSVSPEDYPTMKWTEQQQNTFVGNYLGPALHRAGFSGLKMMALDDNRWHLPAWADAVLNDKTAGKYYSGVAVHWYTDDSAKPILLTDTHNRHPSDFLFYTEACNLVRVVEKDYGDWAIGEKYGKSMMEAFNNWVGGWTDWNMVVNLEGGPMTKNNKTTQFGYNAAIIVNSKTNELYKQPPYYFQAHFSTFVPPGSRRIGMTSVHNGGLYNIAFHTPQNRYVVVLINMAHSHASTVITHAGKGHINLVVSARSIHTVVYS